MRIVKIEVEKLFGIFNHVIPFFQEDRITIIHGPNGVGKTMILKMLKSLFNLNFSIFQKIPFKAFQVSFSDNTHLRIEKELGGSQENPTEKIQLIHSERGIEPFNLSSKVRRIGPQMLRSIEANIPGIVRIGQNQWINTNSNRVFSPSEMIDHYEDFLSQHSPERVREHFPEWLKNIQGCLSLGFISTDRLYIPKSRSRARNRFEENENLSYSVLEYSQELARSISENLARSYQFSSNLDNSFPIRLLRTIENPQSSASEEAIRADLKSLENKRERLSSAGLLNTEKDRFNVFDHAFNDLTKNVLAVYLEDTKKKLDFFNEILEKIELFQKIIGKRFKYKSMRITRNEGLIFKTDANLILSPDCLSSGEQHELVLIYELLFKVKPNSLILIDEPEISLHIEWQKEFLSDLSEITKVSNIEALIATHSPDIINDRWDLTIDLGVPQNE
ncbi:MAG: AAA family ATPase [Candidatus Riflebacteria bacterium]|nr:AAA family ATPase [Candidatus Riflebacteria bacterium]